MNTINGNKRSLSKDYVVSGNGMRFRKELSEYMHKAKYHSLGILSHLAYMIRTFRHFK